jgi:hypothetical protein
VSRRKVNRQWAIPGAATTTKIHHGQENVMSNHWITYHGQELLQTFPFVHLRKHQHARQSNNTRCTSKSHHQKLLHEQCVHLRLRFFLPFHDVPFGHALRVFVGHIFLTSRAHTHTCVLPVLVCCLGVI